MSDLHLIRHGQIAELRLDNAGSLNALTPDMLGALEAHCDEVDLDADLRAVVLTAVEARAFCAGADITAWADLSPRDFARHWVRRGHRAFDRLARLSKPTVAAMGAHAFGGGLELAAACDGRVMAPRATLALPETGLGVVPGWSGTQRLVRILGEALVKEMAVFGRRLTAERATAAGFAMEVAEDARTKALEVAERAAGLSPRANEAAKMMIHAAIGEDRGAMVDALGSAATAASPDRLEGVAAFGEKRSPDFSGA